jgi:hypothetical protein
VLLVEFDLAARSAPASTSSSPIAALLSLPPSSPIAALLPLLSPPPDVAGAAIALETWLRWVAYR